MTLRTLSGIGSQNRFTYASEDAGIMCTVILTAWKGRFLIELRESDAALRILASVAGFPKRFAGSSGIEPLLARTPFLSPAGKPSASARIDVWQS